MVEFVGTDERKKLILMHWILPILAQMDINRWSTCKLYVNIEFSLILSINDHNDSLSAFVVATSNTPIMQYQFFLSSNPINSTIKAIDTMITIYNWP